MQPEPSSVRLPPAEGTVAPDLLDRLRNQKGLVLGLTGAFAALGFVYTLWVVPRWSADSSILMPGSRQNGLLGAAQQLGIASAGGETSLTMFHKVLDSERVLTMVQRQTGYPAKDVRKIRKIEEDPKGGSITISVVDRDRAKALRINRAMLNALGTIVDDLMLPSKGRRVAVLEASLQNKQRQLRTAENRLERFSRSALTAPGALSTTATGGGSGTAAVPTVSPSFRYQDQITTLETDLQGLDARLNAAQQKSQQAGKAGVPEFPAFEAWQKELVEVEGRLSAARATYREDSPEVTRVRKEYDNVRAAEQRDIDRYLGAVESRVAGGTSVLDQERQSILSQIQAIRRLAAAAPREATEYQRLTREVAQLATLVSQLRLEDEQARLDSMDDPNRWVVLDQPNIAEEPVNKSFVRNVGLAAVLGFLISVPLASLREGRRRARRAA